MSIGIKNSIYINVGYSSLKAMNWYLCNSYYNVTLIGQLICVFLLVKIALKMAASS